MTTVTATPAIVLAVPVRGELFSDARNAGRRLRVTWHHELGVAVLSIWQGGVCRATFQLTADEVPDVVAALTEGLSAQYAPAS